MTKRIFYFSDSTRAHIGEGAADRDPLDPERYLIPGNATEIEPPVAPPGKVAVFGTDHWLLVPRETVPSA